ncbi:MAG TPA: RNA 2',3'-cyclic phosphodiesterase [Solirubrobacterales bacterium]|nr:RNA 2',3'-cyclic phosphodiesterase [Solirubrobacterales bacterium]
MTKERLKSPRVKLFVALDLPDGVRRGIAAWGRRELVDPALRPVAPESLHITLAFLGWRPEKQIPQLAEVVVASGAPAPSLRLEQPVRRPERGRARLFALPVESPEAMVLQASLQDELVAAHLFEPERRPFWPHVTVARVRREERGSKRPAPVSRAPGALPEALLRPFGGVRITLYRSEIQPQGAQYTPLAQVELPVGRQ